MENNMYDKAYELARLIEESEQAKTYREIKEKVFADENKRRMVKDFRQMQFEAQATIMSGQEPSAELVDKLQKLAQVLQFDPEITKFFAAEYAMQTIAADMYRIISDACDIDTPQMQE